ncbi:MFS transporter [Cupriavidus sp. CV2]|uniref:MFS transporter n=1 Tax=Cupriavidus ulmosensis TaxID=3065913 RepID=UPI00296AAD20|nr:MFS transporter [Cupriavidus sp. CV2]MDW3687746.1 MFS transporter [Cupriavidus sp. CV2]
MSGRYRYVVAGLLFAAGMINYMDRAALGVVAPIISKELNISPSQLGIIFSSFFFGYSIFAFVGGQLADRYGPRRVFSWAMGGWSLLCGLTAGVTGFTTLLMARALFGFGEGPMNSTTNRAITNWFPRNETGRMIGFSFSGQTLGSAIAGPIVGLVAIAFGWRISFVVIALIGFIWIGFWRYFVTDTPAQNRRVAADEVKLIEQSRSAAHPAEEGEHGTTLREYLFKPSILALGTGLFAVNYTLFIFVSWLPSYFTNALHLDLKQMSILSTIPWACGAIGYFGGGILSDFIYKRMKNPLNARKLSAVLPLALSALAMLVVSFATKTATAVALVAAAVLFLTASSQACWALMHELVPGKHLGGVSGFVHLLGNISGIVGPTVTGFAVQYFGGYSSAFALGATIDLVGVLAMVFVINSRTTMSQPAVSSSAA